MPYVPAPTWLMKKYEVEKLHKVVRTIRTPTDYGLYLRREFTIDDKLIGFKPHDFYNFMKVLISYYMSIGGCVSLQHIFPYKFTYFL